MNSVSGSNYEPGPGAGAPPVSADPAASSLRAVGKDGGRMRLNVYVAAAGGFSRREADRIVEAGRVRVNGVTARTGSRVGPEDSVELDGRTIALPGEKTVIAFYKPRGVTCTERDPHAAVTLKEAFSHEKRLAYAGRLDRDSEGLLLMTDDGGLIDAMMRGRRGHEKEYIVKTARPVSDEQLRKMEQGVFLKELQVKTRPCRIERIGDRTFRIILTQGLNRQIRRMCAAVGAKVVLLKRVRVLNILLGDLTPGEQRPVTGTELDALYAAAGLRDDMPADRIR